MTEAVGSDFPLENVGDLIREGRGAYMIVNAVARRVRDLQLGEKRLAVAPDGSNDLAKIAAQEFLEDKIETVYKPHIQGLLAMAEDE